MNICDLHVTRADVATLGRKKQASKTGTKVVAERIRIKGQSVMT